MISWEDFNRSRSLGAPRVDHVRFHKPVRPGDTLVFRRNMFGRRP